MRLEPLVCFCFCLYIYSTNNYLQAYGMGTATTGPDSRGVAGTAGPATTRNPNVQLFL